MNIEYLIGDICAPALAGIKPSNLISLSKKNWGDIGGYVERLNRQFAHRNIRFEIMSENSRRALVLVYRPEKLKAYLTRPEIRSFLLDFGYAPEAELKDDLRILRSRLSLEDFPHEIGAFLGYPIADILGFMRDSGEGFLMVGDWKVYSEPEKAARLFERYKSCRRAVRRRLSSGSSLTQIFCAA